MHGTTSLLESNETKDPLFDKTYWVSQETTSYHKSLQISPFKFTLHFSFPVAMACSLAFPVPVWNRHRY